MKSKLFLILLIAVMASTSSAAVIFYESFESPVVAGYANNSVPDNGNWVGANQGYGSSNRGLNNEGDGLTWNTPYGNQVFSFRYTNSGLTTSEGAIGNLEAGVTYTISFAVAADQDLTKLPYSVQLIAFDAEVARNDCRDLPAGAVVLTTASGSAPEDGSWAEVNFDFTADAVDNAASIGKDFGIRFLGGSTSANIDYVKVTIGGDLNPSPVDGATVKGGDVVLSWTNTDPNNGNPIYIDVWFGSDPGALTQVVDGVEDANTVTVIAPVADTYYWKVDTHIDGNPDGPPVEDMVFKFYVTDTDDDGLPDEYELMYTNPASNVALDPDADIDNDGLTTMEEYSVTKTKPNLADTDGDTLLDGPELSGVGSRPATNPLKADTDNDGLSDGIETNTDVFVDAADTGTNPVDADWDNDGLKDGVETNTGIFVSAADTGTNPYNDNSDGDSALDWYEVAGSYTDPTNPAEIPVIPYPLPDPDPCSAPAGFTTKPVKVYIMSGQSNMVGMGIVNGTAAGSLETITKRENKFPNLLDGSGAWLDRYDVYYRGVISAEGNGPLKPGFGAADDKIGPELGFGQVMGYFHDEPVLLIKSSIGNRSLIWDYAPPSSTQFVSGSKTYAGYGDSPGSWDTGTTPTPIGWYAGYEWDRMFLNEADFSPTAATVGLTSAFNVVDVLDNFATEYPQFAAQGFEIAGYVWWQGHKDQSEPQASKYESYMANFINEIRDYYENRYPANTKPNAPFVLSTIGFGGWDLAGDGLKVAEAQLAVGDPVQHPEFAGNVKTIESRGYWRSSSESPTGTGYHYNHNSETFMLVGDALGRAMIELDAGFSVDAGDDMITWSGEQVDLDATVQAGVTVTSYTWTANPADGVVFSATEVEDPTVTITKATDNPSTVMLTLTVDDGENPLVSNSVMIDVYDDACKVTIAKGLNADNPTDLNGDCVTSLEDFAEMAAKWLAGEILASPQHKQE